MTSQGERFHQRLKCPQYVKHDGNESELPPFSPRERESGEKKKTNVVPDEEFHVINQISARRVNQ